MTVPRGIQSEKSSIDMASSRNLVSTIGAQASPKKGTEPGVKSNSSVCCESYWYRDSMARTVLL